ncbi:MAG: ornithine cyclodeaminase family protein [Alphaproteobacteria bacterium]|nr:ornithine cyclodeaminase family protein [Alphaproteobacteria bacterium]
MSDILILSRRDLQAVMRFADYVEAVDQAFRLHAEGRSASPPPLHIQAEDGGFHAKAAGLTLGRPYVAVKVNANFPGNRRRFGLPTIQGAVLLLDGANGTPLALLDSIEITIQRTGAATAIAARHLARPDSATATVCGCGAQGRIQLKALHHSLGLRRAFAWDVDGDAAAGYGREMSSELGIKVVAVTDHRPATRQSDVIATCTTASEPFLGIDDVRPGTFIAAIGADNPDKREIAPALMAQATVVADMLAQCVAMGDLHHALAAGAMREGDVHGELADLVGGRRPGRTRGDEITIFDSTGTGIQDVAAAARAYELALEAGRGTRCRLA